MEDIYFNIISECFYFWWWLCNCYVDEKEALINYKFQLKEQFANGKCTNDYFRIVNSIMHMYCNRLTGNRELEEEYFALVRHALYHIKERSELDILK